MVASLATDERSRLLAAYDEQLRGRPDAPSALTIDRLGPLWLTTYAGGRVLITYHDLSLEGQPADEASIRTLVTDAVARCRADRDVVHVDWKTRGHDRAPGLNEALLAHGFEPDETESIMIGTTASLAVDVPLPAGVTLRTVRADADVLAFSELQAEVFGIPVEPMLRALMGRLAVNPLMELWVAEAALPDGTVRMVSGGRLEPVVGTDFAGLWGGRPWRPGAAAASTARSPPSAPGRRCARG